LPPLTAADIPTARRLDKTGRLGRIWKACEICRPHTTPVIVEIASGTQWSVDSWTKAYGQSPDIMTISQWKSRD
jgi:hypothetical protein